MSVVEEVCENDPYAVRHKVVELDEAPHEWGYAYTFVVLADSWNEVLDWWTQTQKDIFEILPGNRTQGFKITAYCTVLPLRYGRPPELIVQKSFVKMMRTIVDI